MVEFKMTDCSEKDTRMAYDRLTECIFDNVPELRKNRYSEIKKKLVNERGETVAVCIAEFHVWNAVYVDTLWVSKEYRNQGLGSRLLETVEKISVENSCNLIHLNTFDFQAKDFYIKHGYEVFGILNDSPEGHCRYYMKKILKGFGEKIFKTS